MTAVPTAAQTAVLKAPRTAAQPEYQTPMTVVQTAVLKAPRMAAQRAPRASMTVVLMGVPTVALTGEPMAAPHSQAAKFELHRH